MITVIDSYAQISEVEERFREGSVVSQVGMIYHVGIDCESIIKRDNVSICTIQIANHDECIIFIMTKIKRLHPFIKEILQSENWIKTGVGLNLDMVYMKQNYSLGDCFGIIDVKTIAMATGITKPSLKNIYENITGEILDKETGAHVDWSKDLTMDSIKYAASDAFASYHVGIPVVQSMVKYAPVKLTIPEQHIVIPVQNNNYIGMLQEYAQQRAMVLPTYTINSKGASFSCTCTFDDSTTSGDGSSKQTAKSSAAKNMLEFLDLI